MHIYIHIHTYVCICEYMCECICECIYVHIYVYVYIYVDIDYLLTECEVCMGKYFSVQTEQTRLIRNLLYGFWLHSSSLFKKALCSC